MRGPVIHDGDKAWCEFGSSRAEAVEAALLLHEFGMGRVTITLRTVEAPVTYVEWRVEVTR